MQKGYYGTGDTEGTTKKFFGR